MAKNDADIAAIIECHIDLTDSEVLQLYRRVRDQVLAYSYSEHGTVEWEWRGRRHQVVDPVRFLKYLEDQIDRYERKVRSASRTSSRNYAQLGKRQA